MSGQAKVLHDYPAQAENQISLKRGQIVPIISAGPKGGWSKGKELGSGKQGYFPSDYVEMLPDAAPIQQAVKVIPPPPIPKAAEMVAAPILRATAMFDFAGTGKNEMPLKIGQVVEIVQRGKPGAWTKGNLGAFPTDYVQFMDTPAVQSVQPPPPARKTTTTQVQPSNDPFGDLNSSSSVSSTASDVNAIFQGLNAGAAADPFADTTTGTGLTAGISSHSDPFGDDPFAAIETNVSGVNPMAGGSRDLFAAGNQSVSDGFSQPPKPSKPSKAGTKSMWDQVDGNNSGSSNAGVNAISNAFAST